MKKLLFILFIIPVGCFAQTDPIKPQFVTPTSGNKDSLGYKLPIAGSPTKWFLNSNYLRSHYSIQFSNNFQYITGVVDLADTIRKTNWVFYNTDTSHPVAKFFGYNHSLTQPSIVEFWQDGIIKSQVGAGGTYYGSGISALNGSALGAISTAATGIVIYARKTNGDTILNIRNYHQGTGPLMTITDSVGGGYFRFDKNAFYYYNPTDTTGATKVLAYNPTTGKVYSQTITGGGTTTNALTNGPGLLSFSFNGGTAGIQAAVDTNYVGLAQDMILSGMGVTLSGVTATVAAGSYRLNQANHSVSSTGVTIPAQDATLNRYTLIVANTSGVLSAINGTLATDAVVPALPGNDILISTIYIPSVASGGSTTAGGGNGKGIQSLSLTVPSSLLAVTGSPATSSNSTIAISLANQSANKVFAGSSTGSAAAPTFRSLVAADIPALSYQAPLNGTGFIKASGTTISYDNSTYLTANQTISFAPTGDVTGSASGTTSLTPALTVNTINGITKSYYDPTSSIQTQLNGKQSTMSGTGFSKFSGSSVSYVNFVYGETPSGTMNSSNVTFTAAHTPLVGTLTVIYNGLIIAPTTDYTVSGAAVTLLLTGHFSTAPSSTDYLLFNYQY